MASRLPRFDKLDVMFLGFVHIAGFMKWLH